MLTSHTCERGVRAANTKIAASAADSMRAAAACSEVSRLLILANARMSALFPKRPQEAPGSTQPDVGDDSAQEWTTRTAILQNSRLSTFYYCQVVNLALLRLQSIYYLVYEFCTTLVYHFNSGTHQPPPPRAVHISSTGEWLQQLDKEGGD